jgi:NTP pyrophosphatase (non-canonical NTP hydrolase)
MGKISIEVNAKDAPHIERLIKALNNARIKHPEKWNNYDNVKVMSIALEESIEIAQAINDGHDDKTKAECIYRIVCYLRAVTGD